MTNETDSKILKKLTEWAAEKGSLPRVLEFYRRLLLIQSEAKSRIRVAKTGLTKDVISNRIRIGTPLLRFEDLGIDWALLRNTFEEVSVVFTKYSEVFVNVQNLNNLNKLSSRLALKEVVKDWFEGIPLSPWIPVGSVSEVLLESVVHATVRSFLISHREVLLGDVNQEFWRRGYCPICGGSPDFAFLDKERGARWLLCSRCDAEWLFQRLECPYCSTKDQDALAYFIDDKGLYRLYVCERCRHYLKAIDLRQTEDEVLMPLERFLTLDLDIQAHKDRYNPGRVVKQDDGMKIRCEDTIFAKEES